MRFPSSLGISWASVGRPAHVARMAALPSRRWLPLFVLTVHLAIIRQQNSRTRHMRSALPPGYRATNRVCSLTYNGLIGEADEQLADVPLEAFPHRPEGSAGFRNRPSREGRVIKLRSVFSACSARSSHSCCSCSNFALVTGSAAASAAAAHLRANCRRYSERALIQCNRRELLRLQGRHCLFRCGAERAACLLHSPRTGITNKGLLGFKQWIGKVLIKSNRDPTPFRGRDSAATSRLFAVNSAD
jgi:hypothetical protein